MTFLFRETRKPGALAGVKERGGNARRFVGVFCLLAAVGG